MKKLNKKTSKLLTFLSILLLIACGGGGEEDGDDENVEVQESPLDDVIKTSTVLNGIQISTWMYQIQELYENAAINDLDNTPYDMLVVEPGFNFKEYPYNVDYLVSTLKQKPNGGGERILLAYIDIGQAEDYRTYWEDSWMPPTTTGPGTPNFIVTNDPDGWEGNYPVAYWDTRWKDIWVGSNGLIEQIANYGFDGVYLDWVEAYDDDKIREAASEVPLNAELEMIKFIKEIGVSGKNIKSDFLVVSQNAPYLLDANPTLYASMIDALATEDTWFYGEGDEPWESPNGGDLTGGERHAGDYSTTNRIAQNKKYLDLGIPVFSVDYCISESNAEQTYINAYENGFIPLVTRVSLASITETPPSFND